MASGLQLGIEIDDRRVRQIVQRAPGALVARLTKIVEAGAIDTQREMTQQAPAGVGGGAGLRGSIRYTLNPGGLKANVYPAVPYAEAVEKGSRPHWVSVKPGTPLRRWARLKGINPFAVQRSIARKGTRPHPYVKPTFVLMEPRIKRNAQIEIGRLAEDIDNGRI